MPAPALAKFADKAGISMERAEHLWDKAKDLVKKQYKFSKKNPRYWALVMGITKKMMGLKESLTFTEYLHAQRFAEEVVKVDFSKSTIGHKMPKGYTKFFAKQKGGKTWALWGKKEDGKEEEIKVYPTKEIADSIASEYNDALKAATQKPQKISMMQAFGSHAMNILYDAGIHFWEKPDYWEDLDKERGKYKPLHDVTLKKAQKELEKIDVKLKTYTSKELWGGDPKHPVITPREMPPEQVFIVKMENGKRYLADKTGARTYIRMWVRIL